MKTLRQLVPILLIGLSLASCSTSSTSTSGTDSRESTILWLQTSAEYDALCLQAYQVAKKRIEDYRNGGVQIRGDMPVAVVLDLDETVLDNSPYNAKLILEGKEYSDESWNEWVLKEDAELIPGALDFLNYLRDNEIKYFFISNRSNKHLKSTYNNLNKMGIELTDKDILLDDGRSKRERRASINDHEIILLLGDNLADFHEDFEGKMRIDERKANLAKETSQLLGKKYVIFPNPMYGDWESAIKMESKKREGQLQLLKSY